MIDDLDEDVIFIKNAISKIPDHSRVTEFIPGPGIHKLKLKFDISKLRDCLEKFKLGNKTQNKKNDYGFGVLCLTQRPGLMKNNFLNLIQNLKEPTLRKFTLN